MRHIGIVQERRGDTARVKLSGGESCGNCGACGAMAELRKFPEVQAANPLGAEPGEEVLVEFDASRTIRSGAMVFIVPILALLGGALAGSHLGGSETAGLLGALGVLGLSVLGIALYDKRLGRRNDSQPKIVEILSPGRVSKPSQGEAGGGGVVQGLLRR